MPFVVVLPDLNQQPSQDDDDDQQQEEQQEQQKLAETHLVYIFSLKFVHKQIIVRRLSYQADACFVEDYKVGIKVFIDDYCGATFDVTGRHIHCGM